MTRLLRTLALLLLCAGSLRAATTVETGLATASTVTATTTVVTLAQYQCAILWTTGQTATGADSAANAMWSIGFSDSTNHRTIAWASDDNVGTTNVGRTLRTNAALEILSNGTPTSVITVTDVNFSALSFDIVFSGTPASAYLIGYMLIGGSDVTDCLVGTQTLTTSTGAQSVTGLSFQPTFGMFLNSEQTAAGTGTQVMAGLGFAASSTKEFAMCWGIDDGQTMTANIDAVSYTNQAASMCGITAGAETIDFLADFTSFNSDGYTVNVSNAATAAWLVPYLLVKGGQWDVGTTTQPASGARTITGMSFQPKGLAIAGTGPTADATVTTTFTSMFGAAISTSTEAATGGYMTDAVLNTAAARLTENSKIVYLANSAATVSSDFTSLNSDGWTITASATGSSPQLGWFAMGDNAAAPTSTGAGWWGSGQFGF